VLASLRDTFGLAGASILTRGETGWRVEVVVGDIDVRAPDQAEVSLDIGGGRVLALAGDRLTDHEAVLLRTFLDELRFARERTMLTSIDNTEINRPGQ
jgi:hypothetical protein